MTAVFSEEGQLFLVGLGKEEKGGETAGGKADRNHVVQISACPSQYEGSNVLKPWRQAIIPVF